MVAETASVVAIREREETMSKGKYSPYLLL